jgi:opacity protein-like surface antigen
MRALTLGAAAALVLGASPAQAATASGASAAALNCAITISNPTQLYTTYVYAYVEVSCNQKVSFIGGYLSLYRDGTYLAYAETYQHNLAYAYKLNMVSCVPGNYHVMGYGFANLDGGAPDFSQRVASTPIAITCT